MKRFLLLIAALLALFAVVSSAQNEVPEPQAESFFYGIYDPESAFAWKPGLAVEMIYYPWVTPGMNRKLVDQVTRIVGQGRFPMITVEPWFFGAEFQMPEDTLLLDIAGGKYDIVIDDLCSTFRSFGSQRVWIRWGHEMDIQGLYPWGTIVPELYKTAYRTFVDRCRAAGVTNVGWVWSPAGENDLEKFYPGDEYVDIIGLTALGNSIWDLEVAGVERPATFLELFQHRYTKVVAFGKPVIITELGVCCGQEHQRQWLEEAFYRFANWQSQFPRLMGVIYFYSPDVPEVWGLEEDPDWRFPPEWYPPTH